MQGACPLVPVALLVLARGRSPPDVHVKQHLCAHRSGLVSFGTYCCWSGSVAAGPEQQTRRLAISISRHGTYAIHRDGRSAISDRTCAAVFNPGDVYRTSHPDRCDDDGAWFSFRRDAVVDVFARHDARVAGHPERPFRELTVPLSQRATLLAAALFRDHARGVAECAPHAAARPPVAGEASGAKPAGLCWDERALEWLDALAAGAPVPAVARPARQAPSRTHVELAHEAERLLALRFAEPLDLDELATRTAVSVAHLCRVFRAVTGSSLHGRLERHRLTAALEAVRDPARDLTAVALDCGFSSHSHFTDRFRRAFGVTPSQFRGRSWR